MALAIPKVGDGGEPDEKPTTTRDASMGTQPQRPSQSGHSTDRLESPRLEATAELLEAAVLQPETTFGGPRLWGDGIFGLH
jgi:hypothetical protein